MLLSVGRLIAQSLFASFVLSFLLSVPSLVGWPSGLRRQVKALVSSEAWVQIPLQPFLSLSLSLSLSFSLSLGFFSFSFRVHSAEYQAGTCKLELSPPSSDGRALAF